MQKATHDFVLAFAALTDAPTDRDPETFGLRYLRHSWTASVTAMILNVVAIVNAGANEANTYYVTPNGDDINPGSQTEPFRTIQKAACRPPGGQRALSMRATPSSCARVCTRNP